MSPEFYVLFGVPTMFLVTGLIAYGMVILADYRHPRVPKQTKGENTGGDTRA